MKEAALPRHGLFEVLDVAVTSGTPMTDIHGVDMSALSHADRIGKLIRLLGSDKDGEIVATVYALRRVLKDMGSDLHAVAEVIEYAFAVENSTPPPPESESPWWQRQADELLARGELWGDREIAFLENIKRARIEPSAGQQKWMNDIANRRRRAA